MKPVSPPPIVDPEVRFFRISLHSIPPQLPLPCDIYVVVAGRPTLIRRAGDVFTPSRLIKLARYTNQFLSPREQRPAFKEFLWKALADPDLAAERRTESTIESTCLQAEEIDDARPAFGPAIGELTKMLQSFGPRFVRGTSISDLASKLSRRKVGCHGVHTALFSMLLSATAFPDQPDLVWKAGVAGLLHDIGEEKLDPTIRANNHHMTGRDWETFKMHPAEGARIVSGQCDLPSGIRLAIVQHHEYFDGSGFPVGLRAEEITPLTRALTLCDVFDELVMGKGGGLTMRPEDAVAMLQNVRPERFDPRLFMLLAAEIIKPRRRPNSIAAPAASHLLPERRSLQEIAGQLFPKREK